MTFDTLSREVRWKLDFKQVIVNLYLLKDDGMHRLPSTMVGQHTYDVLEEVSLHQHSLDRSGGQKDKMRACIAHHEFALDEC